MKKMMIAAILVISMTTMAFAQQSDSKRMHKTPEERAKKTTDILATKLSLSEEQKSKMYAVNLESIKEIEAHRQQRREKERKVRKEAMQKKEEQITSILDDTQRSTYQDLKKERMRNGKSHKRMNRDVRAKKDQQEG
ncbi:hypothetical protein [Olivibacter domesticus]|uniref:DUF4890 domain-containing protein n=1 Tax=Olivibacter domesticus TaxID=407022 RepID=A0A1H7XJV2_OLID1|nr:hypothetical protein [Olivibacter domesticus]SEM34202.1 hypothetical protein SAMN05661044_04935 [Olivibacter domesticus]